MSSVEDEDQDDVEEEYPEVPPEKYGWNESDIEIVDDEPEQSSDE